MPDLTARGRPAVAVDSIGAAFNPYPLSDQSPVNAAITALVLPGAFGPYQTGLANRLAMGYGHHDRRGRPSVQNVSLFGAAQVGIVGRAVG
jgi:hypothetical protein